MNKIYYKEELKDLPSYIAEKTSELQKKYKDFLIPEKDVKELFGIALEGEELEDGETHPNHIAILNSIKSDIEATKQQFQQKENHKSHELTVLEAALHLDKIDRSSLNTKFETGSNYVKILDATDEELAQQFAVSVVMGDFTVWAIGDLGNALQDRGLDGVIDNFCAKTGRAGSTIYSHMKLAREVPAHMRKQNILPTVYKEIVLPRLAENDNKDKELKAKLLEEAEKHNWNSREVRSAIEEVRIKPPGKQGKTKSKIASKGDFLVVDYDSKAFKIFDVEPPFVEGCLILNIKTRQQLTEVDVDGKLTATWRSIDL